MYKYSICLLFILLSFKGKAQYSYKKQRSSFSLVGRLGLPRGNSTKDEFNSFYSIGLRKEFSLGKLISLNAVTDYSTMPGKNAFSNFNVFSIGGGITAYPFYIANLILGRSYDESVAYKDNFYFDEQIETNLNNSNYGGIAKVFAVKIELNIAKIHLSKYLSISPKVGETINLPPNLPAENNTGFSFFYLGAGLEFGKNNKK